MPEADDVTIFTKKPLSRRRKEAIRAEVAWKREMKKNLKEYPPEKDPKPPKPIKKPKQRRATRKTNPYPAGLGTMKELVKRTGFTERTLYRLRDQNIFKVARRYGRHLVLYDIKECKAAIDWYGRR